MIPRDDRDACHDLLARYGHALDWLDDVMLASVFWPDAAIDYGFYRGTAAGFVPEVMVLERGATRRFHLTAGTVFHARGADCVAADSMGITQGVRIVDGQEASTVYYGRYADRFERRDGEWRIAARTYLLHSFSRSLGDVAPMVGINVADRLDRAHALHITRF